MSTIVTMRKKLLEFVFESARRLHPKETILLLRGKTDKNMIRILEVLIPPLATYGRGFSAFPAYMLPIDFSIIGTAHSHPTGNLRPSVEDQNHAVGKIMLIVAFPYRGQENTTAYNREGKKLTLKIT